jgi:hypothetical protein
MNREDISNILITNIIDIYFSEKWIVELICDYMKINIFEIINILQILINENILNFNIEINTNDVKSCIFLKLLDNKLKISIWNKLILNKTIISKLNESVKESDITKIIEDLYKTSINSYSINFSCTSYIKLFNNNTDNDIYKLFPEHMKNHIYYIGCYSNPYKLPIEKVQNYQIKYSFNKN